MLRSFLNLVHSEMLKPVQKTPSPDWDIAIYEGGKITESHQEEEKGEEDIL